ncbi:hypothetical protein [Gordonia caeni]|uniref:Uncharacterized protein n=1 Tax=Gordonia caeni TaxID=1007097 RepID=A0ABP7PQP0_9ACTN
MESVVVWCGVISFLAAGVWSLEATQDWRNKITHGAMIVAIAAAVPTIALIPFLTDWPWWAYPLFWIGAPVAVVAIGGLALGEAMQRFGR